MQKLLIKNALASCANSRIRGFRQKSASRSLYNAGAGGNGISGGQRQRILIARAVYKNPNFILFDEATSSLDAENERKIYDNLDTFLKGKTVIKIAHRLSTVKMRIRLLFLKEDAS